MAGREPITRVTRADGSARYKVVVDIGDDPASGQRRQRRGTFPTLKEARAWLSEVRVAVARGAYVDRSRATLSDYLHSWLDARINLRPPTRDGYRIALAPWHERLGAVPLRSLTRRQVEEVRDAMLSGVLRVGGLRRGETDPRPLSPRTVRLALGTLQMALDDAVRDELIGRNVVRLVERPSGPGAPGRGVDGGAGATLPGGRGVRPPGCCVAPVGGGRAAPRRGVRAAVVTGRPRRHDHHDHRDAEHVHGRPMTRRPKTARGARVLPLPADLVDALHQMRARQVEERRAAGAAHVDSGYVVTDELGQPLSPEVYSDRFARLARAAEVPLIRLHDARHTSVTLKRAAGWPDAVTAAWHGHDESVMRRVYTHVTTEDMHKHARGL